MNQTRILFMHASQPLMLFLWILTEEKPHDGDAFPRSTIQEGGSKICCEAASDRLRRALTTADLDYEPFLLPLSEIEVNEIVELFFLSLKWPSWSRFTLNKVRTLWGEKKQSVPRAAGAENMQSFWRSLEESEETCRRMLLKSGSIYSQKLQL